MEDTTTEQLAKDSPAVSQDCSAVCVKKCKQCGAVKLLEEFDANANEEDGRRKNCAACSRKAAKKQANTVKASQRDSEKKRYAAVMMEKLHISRKDY